MVRNGVKPDEYVILESPSSDVEDASDLENEDGVDSVISENQTDTAETDDPSPDEEQDSD
eukprot:jgi/Psemu1/55993/gm1.55993_g